MDLRAACWGPEPVGVRRLLALADWLPPGAASAWFWTHEAEMGALTAELVHTLIRSGAQDPPDQLRIPRPGRATDPFDDVPLVTGEGLRNFLKGG